MLLFFSIFSLPPTNAKLHSANVVLELDWDLKETQKPVVPRDEIVELNIILKFRLVSDDYIGKGILIGYDDRSTQALIDVNIIETSQWCSAVLNRTRVAFYLTGYEEASFKLSLARWLYLSVIVNVECPNSSFTVYKLSPFCTIHEA